MPKNAMPSGSRVCASKKEGHLAIRAILWTVWDRRMDEGIRLLSTANAAKGVVAIQACGARERRAPMLPMACCLPSSDCRVKGAQFGG